MADATVTSVEVIDGVLHIYGANYTQTTTTVYVSGEVAQHTFVSASELTVDPAPAAGSSIEVEKGGVTSAAVEVPADAASGSGGTTAGGSVADPPAGGSAGNPGPDPIDITALETEQEKVAATLADDDPNAVPSDPKRPYPTGNPPTAEQEQRRAMGLPREEGEPAP